MSSGIAVCDTFASEFMALNKRKSSVIVLKINKEMTVVNVEKTLGPITNPEAEWKSFVATLPENDCRFIISDFMVKDSPTVTKSKIVMILWSPEYAPVRSKMIYASSREAVANKTSGLQKNIQANELDDLKYSEMKEKVFGH